MKPNLRLLCWVALVTLSPVAVHTQNAAGPVEITLEDAVARGLARSHRVDEMSARRDAALALQQQALASRHPLVTASGGYTRTNHVDAFGLPSQDNQLRIIYPDIPDNFRTRLDAQWTAYTGGRLEALGQAARLDALASEDDINALQSDLELEITRAFWALVVADESQTVVDDSLARVGEHLRDVRNQLDAGLVPPNDVLTTEAREARQRMLSIQAHTHRDVAEAELARLVALAPGTRIHPVASLTPQTVNADVDALIAQAQAERADRQALAHRVSAADARREAAVAAGRPTIAIGGGVDYANPNPRIFPRRDEWATSWDASVSVNWTVLDGGRTKAGIAQAEASKRALEARAREMDDVLGLEIRQRLAELESSRAAITAAASAVQAATEARRVVENRFSAGVATNTDVLDAQGALLQANLDRTQALANARMAEARLHRALGQ